MAKILYIISPSGYQDVEYENSRKVIEEAGHEIDVASITTETCTGKFGGSVTPDLPVTEVNERLYSAIVVIGGPGTPLISENPEVLAVVKQFSKLGKICAGICMAPALVFTRAGILEGKKGTCFQTEDGSSKEKFMQSGAIWSDEPVIVDGTLITANGPEAAETFGKAIVEMLKRIQN